MLACIRAIPLTQTDSETFYDEFTFFYQKFHCFRPILQKDIVTQCLVFPLLSVFGSLLFQFSHLCSAHVSCLHQLIHQCSID